MATYGSSGGYSWGVRDPTQGSGVPFARVGAPGMVYGGGSPYFDEATGTTPQQGPFGFMQSPMGGGNTGLMAGLDDSGAFDMGGSGGVFDYTSPPQDTGGAFDQGGSLNNPNDPNSGTIFGGTSGNPFGNMDYGSILQRLFGGGGSSGGIFGPGGIGTGLVGAGFSTAGANEALKSYEEAQRQAEAAGKFQPYNVFSGVGSTTFGPGGATSSLSPQYQGLRDQYLGNANAGAAAAGAFNPGQAANDLYGQLQAQAAPGESEQRANAIAQLQGMGTLGLGVGADTGAGPANPLYSSLLKAQADAGRQRQISAYGMAQDTANQMQQRALGWGGAGLGLDQSQLQQQQLGGYLGGIQSNAALGGAKLAQGPIMAQGITKGGMLSGVGSALTTPYGGGGYRGGGAAGANPTSMDTASDPTSNMVLGGMSAYGGPVMAAMAALYKSGLWDKGATALDQKVLTPAANFGGRASAGNQITQAANTLFGGDSGNLEANTNNQIDTTIANLRSGRPMNTSGFNRIKNLPPGQISAQQLIARGATPEEVARWGYT